MTTYTQHDTKNSAPASWPFFAAIGIALALILTSVGTFWDLTDNEAGHSDGFEYVVVAVIILIAAAVVFGAVVRTVQPSNATRRAVILAVLGVLSLAAFWSGLPSIFAAGSMACVSVQRSAAGRFSAGSLVSIALAVCTVGLAVLAAVAG